MLGTITEKGIDETDLPPNSGIRTKYSGRLLCFTAWMYLDYSARMNRQSPWDIDYALNGRTSFRIT